MPPRCSCVLQLEQCLNAAAPDIPAVLAGTPLTLLAHSHLLALQLEQCLNAAAPDIPAVSEPLRAIAEQVEHEMDNSTVRVGL
mgnify:CR=1 FL=1